MMLSRQKPGTFWDKSQKGTRIKEEDFQDGAWEGFDKIGNVVLLSKYDMQTDAA